MKHTKEEIVAALKIIRDECRNSEDCMLCPFGNACPHCILQDGMPMHWDIVDVEPEKIWRAFK
jgi:hypothetical protein